MLQQPNTKLYNWYNCERGIDEIFNIAKSYFLYTEYFHNTNIDVQVATIVALLKPECLITDFYCELLTDWVWRYDYLNCFWMAIPYNFIAENQTENILFYSRNRNT